MPQGWTFEIQLPDADISNGRINVHATDADAFLYKPITLNNNVDSIIFEWDGTMAYSAWGITQGIRIWTNHNNHDYTLINNNSTIHYSPYSEVVLSADRWDANPFTIADKVTIPSSLCDQHYKVIVKNGFASMRSIKISDSTEIFNTTRAFNDTLNFKLSDIYQLGFWVGTTTDNDSWLDNPSITIFQKQKVNLDSGLVASYPFNGNANDTSGNGNNGTVNGATLTKDRFGNAGKAYSFNGTSDYISVSPIAGLTANQTKCFWIKPNALSSNMYLIDEGNNNNWVQLYDDDFDGKLELKTGCVTNGASIVISKQEFTQTGIWFFVTTILGTDSVLKLSLIHI